MIDEQFLALSRPGAKFVQFGLSSRTWVTLWHLDHGSFPNDRSRERRSGLSPLPFASGDEEEFGLECVSAGNRGPMSMDKAGWKVSVCPSNPSFLAFALALE